MQPREAGGYALLFHKLNHNKLLLGLQGSSGGRGA